MALLFHGALWLVSLVLAPPALVLLAEVVAALLGRRRELEVDSDGARPTVCVLVPAHDEGARMAATLRDARAQLREHDRLLVVADNCTDDTAAVARAEGAEVVERHDPVRRGKGYALAFGTEHLKPNAPEVLIVLDADCWLRPGTIDRLARTAERMRRPVQARYEMLPADRAGAGKRLAAFAFLLKSHVRPLGLQALGAPSPLLGTGMAIPWPVVVSADLATGHLTEDLKLGLELAAAGSGAVYCPEAAVTSFFPVAAAAASAQHARWELGSLQVLVRLAPKLLAAAVARGDAGFLMLVLDSMVPPIGLYAAVLLGWALILSGLAALGAGWVVAAPAAALLVLVLAIGFAWQRFGRGAMSSRDLAGLPSYALGKLSIYGRILMRGNMTWSRTDRT